MYREEQKAVENFVAALTHADAAEIKKYLTEITQNTEFLDGLENNRSILGKRRNPYWYYGVDVTLGTALYVICRLRKPEIVVETGVASGMSSSFILCAMEQNGKGILHSIDFPWGQDDQSGWRIPDYLRHRWHLIIGKTSDKLVPLFKEVGQVDIFLHDSDHSYENMIWEFQTTWVYLKAGDFLLAHNVNWSDAFRDFCKKVGLRGYLLTGMGGIKKT